MKRRGRGLWALVLLGGAAGLWAEPPVPPLERRVTDLTGTLAPDRRDALEKTLEDFETRRGAQVAVLIVPTTRPEPLESYALRVAERWKLGRPGKDDGVLLLVATDDRALRIEVGYGLEGALPDAVCRRIIDEHIVPLFRAGDFAGGVDRGVDLILRRIDGEDLPPPPAKKEDGDDKGQALFLSLFLSLMAFNAGRFWGAFVVGAVAGLWTLASHHSLLAAVAVGGLSFLLSFFVIGTVFSRRWSSGLGGRSRGGWPGTGWGGGGFGGGGFRGGGGNFGGGGASGRW